MNRLSNISSCWPTSGPMAQESHGCCLQIKGSPESPVKCPFTQVWDYLGTSWHFKNVINVRNEHLKAGSKSWNWWSLVLQPLFLHVSTEVVWGGCKSSNRILDFWSCLGLQHAEYLICPHVCRSSSATGDFSSWGSIRSICLSPDFWGWQFFLAGDTGMFRGSIPPSVLFWESHQFSWTDTVSMSDVKPENPRCSHIPIHSTFDSIPVKITSSSSSSKLLCLQVSNVGLRPLVPSSPPRKTPLSARRRSRRTSSARRVGTPPSPQAPQPGTSHPPVIIFQWMECLYPLVMSK